MNRIRTSDDMWERLQEDPGTRTFGQLAQEREWAHHEITRLRDALERASHAKPTPVQLATQAEGKQSPMMAHRLLRIAEVKELVGLGNSRIYQLQAEGRFPSSVKLSERSVRWRMSEVLAWIADAGSK